MPECAIWQLQRAKVSGKAYLDAEQVAHMDGLHDHIKATGRMEGYPIPEPTGPKPEEEIQPTTAITVTQVSAPTVQEEQLNTSECRQEGNSELDAIASLVRSAQNKAVGVLIAENMLAERFIKNPDSLPEELRTKIKQSSKVPDIDPFAYANSLVNLAKNPGVEAAA